MSLLDCEGVLIEWDRCHQALDRGFSERIEYRIEVGDRWEHRTTTRSFQALLLQLDQLSTQPLVTGPGGPSGPNKAGSRPPTNSQYSDMIDRIHEQAISVFTRLSNDEPSRNLSHVLIDIREAITRNCLEQHNECVSAVGMARRWVRDARVLLGYETRQVTLANTSCHLCGGALQVASDASTDVVCIDCGHNYDRLRWIDLL